MDSGQWVPVLGCSLSQRIQPGLLPFGALAWGGVGGLAWPTLPAHCVISSIGTRFQGPEPASRPPSSRWQLFSQAGGPGLRTQTQSSHTNKHPDTLCPEPAPKTSSDLELLTPHWSWTKGKERAKFLRERPLRMGSELRTGSAKAGIQQLDPCVPPGSPRGQPCCTGTST